MSTRAPADQIETTVVWAPTTTLQLDLFATSSVGTNRLADAYSCLAVAYPYTMIRMFEPARPTKLSRETGFSRPWAYAHTGSGIRFEHADTWGGWSAKPAHEITWLELAEVAADPRLAPVRRWARGPSSRLTRPYELFSGGRWNQDYYDGDHAEPSWPARVQAWRLLIDVLNDHSQLAQGLA